jgi:hypothetical protein
MINPETQPRRRSAEDLEAAMLREADQLAREHGQRWMFLYGWHSRVLYAFPRHRAGFVTAPDSASLLALMARDEQQHASRKAR